jgi:hypothetical protein
MKLIQNLRSKFTKLLNFSLIITLLFFASLIIIPQNYQVTANHIDCDNISIDSPTSDFFHCLNPLYIGESEFAEDLSTPGGIVSRLLLFLFPLAGLVLFAMIVWGGFEILVKANESQKALDAGRNRITAAIVGFLLLFSSYWIIQIAEVIFGIVIL